MCDPAWAAAGSRVDQLFLEIAAQFADNNILLGLHEVTAACHPKYGAFKEQI
jgi:hypothetical protein